MKPLKVLIFLLSMPILVWAQGMTLEECQRLAQENYPLIKRYSLIEQTTGYTIRNISKGWLRITGRMIVGQDKPVSIIKKDLFSNPFLVDSYGCLIPWAYLHAGYGFLTFYDKNPDLFMVKALKEWSEDSCSLLWGRYSVHYESKIESKTKKPPFVTV